MKQISRWLVMAAILTTTTFGNCIITKPVVSAGIGYASQDMCARIFINGDTEENSLKFAVARINEVIELPDFTYNYDVDYDQAKVTVSAFGQSSESVFRENLGCTNLAGISEEELRAQPFQATAPPTLTAAPWPYGSGGVDTTGVGEQALDEIDSVMHDLFAIEDANTQVVLVALNGKLIAKRYADGYSDENTFHGWSMTKTVIALLLGILQDEVADTSAAFTTDTHASKFLTEWDRKINWWEWDPRRDITIGQIVNMESGLDWSEDYTGLGDVTEMFYTSNNMAGRVLTESERLFIEPEYRFVYSSGDSQLLAEIITRVLKNTEGGSSLQAGYDFYQDKLLQPLGIRSAAFTHDSSGTFSGAAFLHMAAEDWLRLGQLVLNSGQWGEGDDETQVVNEDWIDFMATPSPGSKLAECPDSAPNFYGGQVWLYYCKVPDFPEDVINFIGANGQFIYVVPSADLVFLKMGVDMSEDETSMYDAIRRTLVALEQDQL